MNHLVRKPASSIRFGTVVLASLLAVGVAADASASSRKTRNTLIGAGLGAAGGALLTHGDPWGALGGAAAGGLIGNVITDDHHRHDWNRRDNRHYDNRYYDNRRDRRDPRDRRDWRDHR